MFAHNNIFFCHSPLLTINTQKRERREAIASRPSISGIAKHHNKQDLKKFTPRPYLYMLGSECPDI